MTWPLLERKRGNWGFKGRGDYMNPRELLRKLYTNTFAKTPEKDRAMNDADLDHFASELGVEVPMMKAFAKKETRDKSFAAPGKAAILFERHQFYRLLKERGEDVEALRALHPDIINPNSGGYGGYGADGLYQHTRLEKAKEINEELAISSASWGRFQVMGFNYWMGGYTSPEEMEIAMNSSEYEHLLIFVGYLRAAEMIDAMNNHDYNLMAYKYNGPGYPTSYPEDLKKYYEDFSK